MLNVTEVTEKCDWIKCLTQSVVTDSRETIMNSLLSFHLAFPHSIPAPSVEAQSTENRDFITNFQGKEASRQ